jgi:osmotically inducible protein OsmC
MTILYTTTAHVTGGRDGRARSDDGRLDAPLAFPVALGGKGEGTNPEQLFAAGFAGCFASSVAFAARGFGLDAGAVTVDGTVSLTRDPDGAFGIAASLAVTAPGLAEGDRDRVIAEAKRICAYSNATRGNVALEVTVG